MRVRCVLAAGVVLVTALGAGTRVWSHEAKQDANAVAPCSGASAGVYPESADGLKKLVEDIFEAVKWNHEAKIWLYMSGLVIPEHGAWFVETFGAAEGARLEAKYSELLPRMAQDIRKSFEYALKGQRTDVGVKVLGQGETAGMGRAILAAMVRPTSVYVVDGSSPKEKYSTSIGDFVYVDGGFRYVNTQVWQELSTAPPMRIFMSGNIANANVVKRVDPVLPEEARKARLKGDVLVRIVVATDGTIKELNVVKGDPVLAKAALEAVKQWRYKPILLNGKAVEVESFASVVFRGR